MKIICLIIILDHDTMININDHNKLLRVIFLSKSCVIAFRLEWNKNILMSTCHSQRFPHQGHLLQLWLRQFSRYHNLIHIPRTSSSDSVSCCLFKFLADFSLLKQFLVVVVCNKRQYLIALLYILMENLKWILELNYELIPMFKWNIFQWNMHRKFFYSSK